jgi:hypothetical protein
MRVMPVLLVVLAVVLGCGRFGGGTTGSNSEVNTNSASTPVAKAVDIPNVIDKSHDEINRIVGQQSKMEGGSASWQIPKSAGNPHGGSLNVVYSKDKKASLVSLTLDTIYLDGGQSSSGYPTAERLGQLAGLDIKGTPSQSTYEDKYYDFMVNGKKCELTAGKLLESYNSLKLYCP